MRTITLFNTVGTSHKAYIINIEPVTPSAKTFNLFVNYGRIGNRLATKNYISSGNFIDVDNKLNALLKSKLKKGYQLISDIETQDTVITPCDKNIEPSVMNPPVEQGKIKLSAKDKAQLDNWFNVF